MYVKKKVIDSVYNHITVEQDKIKYDLRKNIRMFRELEREQTILKRKIAKFGELLKFLKKDN